jgi:hypothetical protein
VLKWQCPVNTWHDSRIQFTCTFFIYTYLEINYSQFPAHG